MKAQEIFDTLVRHLRQMPRQSKRYSGRCAYRGENGLKCPVGALVSDEEIRIPEKWRPPNFLPFGPYETWDDLGMNAGVALLCTENLLPERLQPHTRLLEEFQCVHDDVTLWNEGGQDPKIEPMKTLLDAIASDFHLNTNVLDEQFR